MPKGAFTPSLLGSGVSRSAQIPTGWEVVLDLASRLARAAGEDCKGEAAADWYKNEYGDSPDYSRLLDELAGTPAERQQLLRGYLNRQKRKPSEALSHPRRRTVLLQNSSKPARSGGFDH